MIHTKRNQQQSFLGFIQRMPGWWPGVGAGLRAGLPAGYSCPVPPIRGHREPQHFSAELCQRLLPLFLPATVASR
jgi:hypothetical protein